MLVFFNQPPDSGYIFLGDRSRRSTSANLIVWWKRPRLHSTLKSYNLRKTEIQPSRLFLDNCFLLLYQASVHRTSEIYATDTQTEEQAPRWRLKYSTTYSYRRPRILATPKELPVCCRRFGRE
ncbi:hypothetical protein EVAR_23404_1 [Eumeta japonica]|uniref:Uncharacterized protein n=1 Tax=Eumeta variegata TaxID=151549 RepID=A0A4C1VUB7_EUMVA|nr:hypothetical protein EVAR_23404_1 [Eumeta japonica]